MNPFRLLKISPDASPREIVQAAASALREQRHSARDIARARKELMNPETRFFLDFIYTVDLEPLMKDIQNIQKDSGDLSEDTVPPRERPDIFDQQV